MKKLLSFATKVRFLTSIIKKQKNYEAKFIHG